MQNFSIKLINHLTKRYAINISEATAIIEDEWDYIEQAYVNGDNSFEVVAKELVDMYMVA